ncbi:MAG: hypothetical protein GOMPHAMPRED_004724 [Gomphillus americanus]|uniref:Uncharacterized protein n=1 Tax=Gomphillus americanus TaxID=1940652 RepID=A0A8H3I6B3_9LECA|nr:MAG: hypothetical protein GOMPHAMPRED_004724 [Gomphillus americanus]
MLLKSLLGIRVTQLLLSLVFLTAVSWVLYLVRSSPATQSQPTHVFTTTLRFLLPIATLPYASHEIFRSIKVLRGKNSKFALASKSRAFKIGRVFFEFALGALWFLALIFSLGASSWSLTGDSGSGVSGSSGSNSTAPLTDANTAAVIPPSSTAGVSTLIVPPGGKVPMVLGSLMWIGLVGLFAMSAVGVVVETFRNWRVGKAAAGKVEEA